MIPLLFAHGGGAGPDDPPAPRLRALLGPGYAWSAPDLGDPDPAAWSRTLGAWLTAHPTGAVLIGHSLGGSHLLKCLAELGPHIQPRGIVALAPPLWGQPGWDMPDFALPSYAPEALADRPIRLFHGRDDDVVGFDHMAAWGALLPRARLYPLAGQGHTFDGDLSAVALAVSEL